MPKSTPTLPFAYELLYERLRKEGFRLGVDHQLRLQELLALDSFNAEQISPAELKTFLCPIFAINRRQQETFYRVFDELYAGLGAAAIPQQPQPSKASTTTVEGPSIWERMVSPWVFASLVLLLAGGTYFISQWSVDTSTTETGPIDPTPAPTPTPERITREAVYTIDPAISRTPLELPDPWQPMRWTLIASPFLLLGGAALFRGIRRRAAHSRLAHLKGPHYWPLRVQPSGTKIYPASEVRQLASRMRRRQDGLDNILDIQATIHATIRRAGYLQFISRAVRRPPEYVVLIERKSANDHFAALIGDLLHLLKAEGVHLSCYYFDGDPYRLTTAAGDEILLLDLAGATPGYRLLAFGSSSTFLDPVSGSLLEWVHPALEKWPLRAMLVDDDPGRRRLARLREEAGLCVVPASLEGVSHAVEFFDAGGSGSGRSFPAFRALPEPPYTDPLERDDLFPAIAAASIYPELNWNLTLQLVRTASPDLATEINISRLSRIAWFRDGEIPAAVREDLAREIPEGEHTALKASLLEILEWQRPPQDTFAWENWNAILRVYSPGHKSWWSVPLVSPAGPARDAVFQAFLDWRPKDALSFLTDGKVRNWLFRDGLRGQGVKTAAWLPVAALMSLAMGFSLKQPEPQGGTSLIAARVIDESGKAVPGVSLSAGFNPSVSDANGAAGVLVEEGIDQLLVTTEFWPLRVEADGAQTRVRVSRVRPKSGPLQWYGIRDTGGRFLIDFSGEFKSVLARDVKNSRSRLPLRETEQGFVTSFGAPPGTYVVEIDGKTYGEFTVKEEPSVPTSSLPPPPDPKRPTPKESDSTSASVRNPRLEIRPSRIRPGQAATLRWDAENATPQNLRLQYSYGDNQLREQRIWIFDDTSDTTVPMKTIEVRPTETTTYRLISTGKTLREVRLVVEENQTPLQLRLDSVECLPRGESMDVEILDAHKTLFKIGRVECSDKSPTARIRSMSIPVLAGDQLVIQYRDINPKAYSGQGLTALVISDGARSGQEFSVGVGLGHIFHFVLESPVYAPAAR